jgi:hypothetical protein
MEYTDWATIALIIGGVIVEARRGSLTAWVGVTGVVVAYRLAVYLYPHVFTNMLAAHDSFLVLFCMLMVPVMFLSMAVKKATEKYMASIDFILGGLGGAISGMVLAGAIFEYLVLANGPSYPAFAHSLFRPIVYNLVWYQQLVQRFAH